MPLPTEDSKRVTHWLAAVRLCRGLDTDQLDAIGCNFSIRSFRAGETIALAGDPVTEFWVVVEGELDSFLTDARGRERPLGKVRQGETVGEVIILERTATRPVRFTARTNGTLLVAPAELLRQWIKTYPQMMQNLFFTLSERLKTVAGAASRSIPSPRLGIVASSPRGLILTGRLVANLLSAGERLSIWANDPDLLINTQSWPKSLPIKSTIGSETPLLQPPPPEVDRQIVIWSPGHEGRGDSRSLTGCDEILWMLESHETNRLNNDLKQVPFLQGDASDVVRIVWLLDSDCPVAPIANGWTFKKPDVKVMVASTSGVSTRQETLGVSRLARALRGFSIGIALAGGGAKGMAHFGVLQVLEESGISFDVMSGTSAGAMAGIIYAAGMTPQDSINHFQEELTPSKLFRCLPNWPNWYLVSQYRRRAWEGMLRKYLHQWRLEQLSIPFNAVTVDLVQARTVVRKQGDAVHAILESINLPIVSRPILRDGMALVDGGVLNNLPADVLAEDGADFVIGVDVSSHVRSEFAHNRPDMPTCEMRNAGSIDTLFRIFETQAHNIGKLRNRAVDFWIKPDTSCFGLAEFHRSSEISVVGQTAAQAVVAELKQRLYELEKRLLDDPASKLRSEQS